MSVAFLITSLVICASPGTGVLYTVGAGISRGRRASVVAAAGCTLGILPHVVATLAGLAALLYASSVAFQAVKIAGVVYLLFMAWSTWREHGALQVEPGAPERSTRDVIVTAVLINVLNPKLSIFFVAFLPQFIAPGDGHRLLTMVQLSAVFMAMTFAVFVVYGLAAAWMRHHVLARPRVLMWMRRTFATAFVGLGAKLALTHR